MLTFVDALLYGMGWNTLRGMVLICLILSVVMILDEQNAAIENNQMLLPTVFYAKSIWLFSIAALQCPLLVPGTGLHR